MIMEDNLSDEECVCMCVCVCVCVCLCIGGNTVYWILFTIISLFLSGSICAAIMSLFGIFVDRFASKINICYCKMFTFER